MNDSKTSVAAPIASFFPMEHAREKQTAAMDFIQRMIERGIKHIVVSAPTGIGKSGIGVAVCNWARSEGAAHLDGVSGGYYLITQKLLQKQLDNDFPGFKQNLGDGASITASLDYECPRYGNCGVGTRMAKSQRCNHPCPYREAKEAFAESTIAVTNYPYFFAQYEYVGALPKRKVVVVDEAHTLEKQILGFIDISINLKTMEEFGVDEVSVPRLDTFDEFVVWVTDVYRPAAQRHLGVLEMLSQGEGAADKIRRQFVNLDQHICKLNRALELSTGDADGWVYWQEIDDKTRERTCICKPLDAAPFMDMIENMADVVVYMSAYPGSKETWCKMFDFKKSELAWKNLNSTFDPEYRPIYLSYAGSMSRRNVDQTLPSFFKMLKKIILHHADEKGIIHCNSYKLGDAIANELGFEFDDRLVYPKKADEREECMKRHIESDDPTIILSPSMTEGFDFKDDMARWQIIAKVPYPYLGDKQVSAKKDADPDWYTLQTAMIIVQAAGRIVRSDGDYGSTYILDSDFERLKHQCADMFPAWFTEAFVEAPGS